MREDTHALLVKVGHTVQCEPKLERNEKSMQLPILNLIKIVSSNVQEDRQCETESSIYGLYEQIARNKNRIRHT
jgi:hypothetical protein